MIIIRLKSYLFKYIVLSFIFLTFIQSAYSVQSGQIQYVIPIDYSMIDETELKNEAESLYQDYINATDEIQKRNLLDKMLSAYSVLGNVDEGNPLYFTRLGIVFDKLGKDRYAKSNFCRASNLVPNYPYSYYSYANFFFERGKYRLALREYMRAYNAGYQNNYDTLYQIGVIYEKFGDFASANSYYKKALSLKYTEELNIKIQKLENIIRVNPLYNDTKGKIR